MMGSFKYEIKRFVKGLSVLKERCDFEHELQDVPDEKLEDYITEKLTKIPLQDFLSDVTLDELTEPELENDDSIVSEDEPEYE